MKACAPFLVAVLCGLAWAGKSFSGGHGSRLGGLKRGGLEQSRMDAVLTQGASGPALAGGYRLSL